VIANDSNHLLACLIDEMVRISQKASSSFTYWNSSRFFKMLLAGFGVLLCSISLIFKYKESLPTNTFFLRGSGIYICAPKQGLRPLKTRDELGDLLEEHGFTSVASKSESNRAISQIPFSKSGNLANPTS
jgi:hypothetical protein